MSADGRRGFHLRVPQLKRKAEFYIFEALAFAFGGSASLFFFLHWVGWQTLAICGVGYAASFAMMVTVRCSHCREPLGRVNGRWGPIAETRCSKCNRDPG